MILVLTILMVVGAAISFKFLEAVTAKTVRATETTTRLEAVRQALVQFVTVNGRLPCPADGAANTGLETPGGPAMTCANPDGGVPWVTLGLNKDAAFDGWARKISYRVYAGATGLTIAGGADMVNCNSAPSSPVAPSAPNRLCDAATHNTSGELSSPIGFLSPAYRPGLTVNDVSNPVPVAQVGFVLISHGESGNGAWMDGGVRAQPLPGGGNIGETANVGAGATFYRSLPSDKAIPSTAANHFDDEVRYMTIADLIKAANRSARNWTVSTLPPPPIEGAAPPVNLTPGVLSSDPSVTIPSNPDHSTGVQRITLQPAFVATPLIISTAPGYVIAFDSARNGIGVCSAPPASCNNQPEARLQYPEYLSFRLMSNTAEKVAFGLSNFGGNDSFTLEFRRNSNPVGPPVLVTSSSLTNLQPNPPDSFDEVIVSPRGSSSFFIQSIRFCDAASNCQ